MAEPEVTSTSQPPAATGSGPIPSSGSAEATVPTVTDSSLPPAPIITLENCIIRPYVFSDAPYAQRGADNPKIAKFMRDSFPSPYTLESATNWIHIANGDNPVRNFAICVPAAAYDFTGLADQQQLLEPVSSSGVVTNGTHSSSIPSPSAPEPDSVCIGGIGLKVFTDVDARRMELGYWLSEPYWGRGIVTDAVRAFCRWAFERFPDVRRLEAEVYENNPGSARVLAKVGFMAEGRRRKAVWKNGEALDLLIFGLLREEVEGWAA